MDKVRLTLIIDKDIHEQVKVLAEKDIRSINSFINKVLRDLVDSQGSK
jgi:predicted HicB family RNase H-like nuclease